MKTQYLLGRHLQLQLYEEQKLWWFAVATTLIYPLLEGRAVFETVYSKKPQQLSIRSFRRSAKWKRMISNSFRFHKIHIYKEQLTKLTKNFTFRNIHNLGLNSFDFPFTALVMLSNKVTSRNPPKNASTVKTVYQYIQQ